MTETPEKNIAETVVDLMKDIGQHSEIRLDADPECDLPHFVAIPKDRRVEDLTPMIRAHLTRLQPERRKGTATLTQLDSLISWAIRHKDAGSVLFANPGLRRDPSLTCIVNYSHAGAEEISRHSPSVVARHGDHRGIYTFPFSEEWKAWGGISGKPLDKDEMGEFIEKYAYTIEDPTPAIIAATESEDNATWENKLIVLARQIDGRYGQLVQLLHMSRQFQVFETSNLAVTTNRDTGEASIQFVNEHADPEGAPIKVPNLVIVAIPVFDGGARYRIPVRFRYRRAGQSVKFTLSLHNANRAFDAAFDEAITFAATETGLPLFLGAPEA